MKQIKNIISKTYKFIVYFIGLILFIAIIYFNLTSQQTSGIVATIITVVFISIFLFVINKFIINKVSKKINNIITIILLILFLMLTVLSVKYFRVEYNWDFRYIMETAKQLYETNSTENLYYYKIYPNNIVTTAIAYIGMVIFRGEIGAYIINILFIFGAAVFTVLCARKIGKEQMGTNVALLLVMLCPLYLYAPIVYSDTLSVMFPVMTLYFWLLAKENIKKSNIKKSILFVILMIIAAFIGFLVKATSAIVLIAICIDWIFTFNRDIKYLLMVIILFIIFNSIYNFLCTTFITKDEKKNNTVIPYTHWVMMGMNKPEEYGGTSIGWGAYSQNDVDATNQKYTYEEKVEYNLQTIKERFLEYGLYGYLSFLKHKFIYVWTDPTFYVLNTIGWDTINKDSIPYDIVLNYDSGENKTFLTYMDGFYIILLLCILAGIIYNIFNKDDSINKVLIMSVIGIAIFLLIWEARSRYLYNFLPILCLLAVIGIKNIQQIKYKDIWKKIKRKEVNKYEKDITSNTNVL